MLAAEVETESQPLGLIVRTPFRGDGGNFQSESGLIR